MNQIQDGIRVYGTARCHKTQYYMKYLRDRDIPFVFLDVEKNEDNAAELRSLYESGKLNFPTLTIFGKKLRNPRDYELEKWLNKKAEFINQKK